MWRTGLLWAAAVSAVGVMASVGTTRVDGTSMQDTLFAGDRIVVLRTNSWPVRAVAGWLLGVQDVVVARDPSRAGAAVVKRIVAVGGDEVAVVNGHVTVNGKVPLLPNGSEPRSTWSADSRADRVYVVPDNAYFLLADNRGTAVDSRVYGAVSRDGIIGMVIAILPRN